MMRAATCPRRRWVALVTAAAMTAVLTGCGFESLNSFHLPGTKGSGPGSYTVRIELRNALNVVPNTPVMVDDVTVGTIRSVELKDWTAVVTVSLDKDVVLPENATATIGQTSLLGAKHIELAPPTQDEPVGRLHDGSVVPITRSGHYPETEDVLASAAALLNGGGLGQLKTITTEVNKALGGREGTTRDLLHQVDTTVTRLDEQKASITRALDSLDRISGRFREQNPTIERALAAFPPALDVLNQERENLVNTLVALGDFGRQVDDVVTRGGDDIVRNVAALRPVLKGLADAGSSLHESLWQVGTLLFPLDTFGEVFRGDYINLWGTVDLTLPNIDRTLLSGTPLEGSLTGLHGLLGGTLGLGDQAANPLTAPAQQPPTPAPAQQGQGMAGQPQAPASPTPTPSDPSLLGGLVGGLLGGGSR
ncbi:MCE family protein [Candidatus Protofrankia datiscae]|uniref:Virulence factor Mce family protein n=3 Tax=Frankiaceae TaxID=74712 RepID=F8B413_9ACTN|nr:MCE family protein [Candidatus Protofrankia datiscae]AEH10026.1 virulence factor Mce family protein [Candidatus Protofrankia datiscae]